MGSVLSSDTIYAVAYLTDLGRKLLFDPITNNRFIQNGNTIIDAFKPVYFSMSDPDYNYNITPGFAFETGDIANVSGKNDDCIKGTIVKEESNLISVNGQVNGIIDIEDNSEIVADVPYLLTTDDADSTIVVNVSNMPIITE
jgi:hypothetical protein